MTKKTEQPSVDKAEQQRLERAERIKRLQGKDGKKKQIKTRGRVSRVLIPILVTVAVIAALVWGSLNLGLIHRYTSPMSVGNVKISMVEYNYHYASYYQTYNQYAQYGYVPKGDDGNLDLSAETGLQGYETMSWGDYLHVITQQSMQQVIAFSTSAAEEDISLSEASTTQIDSFFNNISSELTTDVARSNYYEQVYGRGANEKTLRPVLERTMLANQYAAEHPETYTVTEDEITSFYNENKSSFDTVEYRLFTLTVPTADAGATDADKEELKTETEEKANEMLGKITDFDSFNDLAIEYAGDNKGDYKLNDLTYFKRTSARIGNTTITEWLFDEDRVAGDKEVLNSGSNFYVVYFNDRVLLDEHYPTVRHMLFEAREDKATEEEIEAAKVKAEETVAKIKTEEDMISLSEELLEEKEVAEATIYENVARGTMVTPFEDWIYDTENKPGDTGVVQTTYGFHVMYLVSRSDDTIWHSTIEKQLRSDAFAEESEKLVEEDRFDVSINKFGVYLAGY